jgi:fluoride ion exporter CrcB/FEX
VLPTHLAEARGVFSPESRALLFIGFLGGFTTFSIFTGAERHKTHIPYGGMAWA